MRKSKKLFFALLCVLALGMAWTACELEKVEKEKPVPEGPVVITRQPQDITIARSGSTINVVSLSVIAEARNEGSLSYQWYKNSTRSNEGGEEISGATSSAYEPPLDLINSGSELYFYVVITNTVTNEQVTSVAVEYKIIDEPTTVNNTVTVDLATKYQYVRGFGGSSIIWANFSDDWPEDFEAMHGNRPDQLGLNLLRMMIPPDSTDIDDTMKRLINNEVFVHLGRGDCRYGSSWWYEENDIPAPTNAKGHTGKDNSDYYEIAKVVNKYGGYILASPWSPPGYWKQNQTYCGGADTGKDDSLIPDYYGDYANYLKRFAEIMKENGAPIYTVSLQNEHTWKVSYEGCLFSATQHVNFFKEVGHYTSEFVPKSADAAAATPGDPPGEQGGGGYYKMPSVTVSGWGGGRAIPSVRVMSGEAHSGIEAAGDLGALVANNADGNAARQGYDILARHIYGANGVTANNFLQLAQFHPTDPKEIWQTEWSAGDDNNPTSVYTWNRVWEIVNAIDYTIRLCNESGFIWFPSRSYHAMMGDGGNGTVNHELLPRGWAMSHYAKYAKETGRVGLTVTGTNAGNVNQTDSRPSNQTDARWVRAKMTAHVTLNDDFYNKPVEDRHINWRTDPNLASLDSSKIKAISFVFSTPSNNAGQNGVNMGTIKIQLPDDFKIGKVSAIKSWSGNYHKPAEVIIGADGKSAFVEMPANQMLSIRFEK